MSRPVSHPAAAAPAVGPAPDPSPPPAAPAPGGDHAFCPRFHHAVELIGRRWTGVVVRAMLAGATRYTDIRAAVPDLSDKMLAERLKELEAEGVVTRTVVPSTPVRVEYHLTQKGRALDDAVAAVAAWAEAWLPGASGALAPGADAAGAASCGPFGDAPDGSAADAPAADAPGADAGRARRGAARTR